MNRKVMLIMDEPLDCTDCPLTDLSSMTGDKLCLASNMRWIETQNEYKKPDWCPLKPMPNYIPTPYLFRQMQIADGLQNSDGSVPVYSEDYMNGWNDCIEELEESETKNDLSTDEGWWRDYELYEMQND